MKTRSAPGGSRAGLRANCKVSKFSKSFSNRIHHQGFAKARHRLLGAEASRLAARQQHSAHARCRRRRFQSLRLPALAVRAPVTPPGAVPLGRPDFRICLGDNVATAWCMVVDQRVWLCQGLQSHDIG